MMAIQDRPPYCWIFLAIAIAVVAFFSCLPGCGTINTGATNETRAKQRVLWTEAAHLRGIAIQTLISLHQVGILSDADLVSIGPYIQGLNITLQRAKAAIDAPGGVYYQRTFTSWMDDAIEHRKTIDKFTESLQ